MPWHEWISHSTTNSQNLVLDGVHSNIRICRDLFCLCGTRMHQRRHMWTQCRANWGSHHAPEFLSVAARQHWQPWLGAWDGPLLIWKLRGTKTYIVMKFLFDMCTYKRQKLCTNACKSTCVCTYIPANHQVHTANQTRRDRMVGRQGDLGWLYRAERSWKTGSIEYM